jgi:hypothetical protein
VKKLTDNQVTEIAYREIFDSAESMLEDWMDEDGQYSEEDFERIFEKSFELLNKLREIYL